MARGEQRQFQAAGNAKLAKYITWMQLDGLFADR